MVSVVLGTTVVGLTQQQHKVLLLISIQTKNYTEAEHLFCFFFDRI